MEDLSSLLNTARELTSHVARSDLPPVNLSLEQIEAQSRRLGRQQAHTPDNGKGSYLLAKANVDAPALASSIATLNTANTFLPLNPLNDTDVSGYLKHAYEQTLISTIEEGRRQTEQEFYQNLELRARKDWEARKKRIFEELGVGQGPAETEGGDREGRARFAGQHAGMRSKKLFGASYVAPPAQSITMNTKFMAYLRVVSELNSHRLASTSYPLLANLSEAARAISEDALRITHTYDILTSITGERPKLPPSHTQAHILNSAVLERAYARAYLGSQESQEALELRKRIAEGSRRALEFQYWEIVERTIQQNPIDAGLGGDPSPANKTRAFLNVQFYKNGAWDSRISLLAGKPLWAILYYLVRTGHLKEAIESASQHATILNSQEELFTTLLQTWAESPDRRLPLNLRERLLANYNSHVLHARDVDPFKLALIKLIGRIDPQRRNIPLVIASTEDWAWFQLAMIDEEAVSLKDFAQSLLTYKKSHFEPEGKPRRGIWACLLLICGLFEQAVAALYEIPELQVEAVHLAISLSYYGLLRVPGKAESSDVEILITSPVRPAMLNLALLISRYIRQFQRTDPKEALQYVYCITLNSDKSSSLAPKQNPASREQVEIARQLVQRVILGCDGKWDDLVGAFREDGTKIPGILERSLPLLHLGSLAEYHEAVLLPAADECEQEGKLVDAIKLYNIAGAHDTVIACLTRALGNVLSDPMGGEGDSLESLTRNILDHYSRRGDAIGPKRQDLMCLLKVREAGVAYDDKQYETALAAIEASGLIPFDGDVQAITRKADSFKENDEAITMNLSHILLLAMNILHGLHGKVKHAMHGDNSRTAALAEIRRKSRALMMFASMQRYRMSADVYGQLTRLDVAVAH